MIQPSRTVPRHRAPLAINEFLGMDVTNTRDLRRSPDMLNCILDDEGTPEMRCGYEKLFATSLGTGPILGLHQWIEGHIIIHHGTKLYKALGSAQPVEIYTGLGGTGKSYSFKLSNKMVIGDGSAMLIYDGTTVSDISANAYVPTFFISTPPAGGGTRIEDLNLLNPRWKQQCSTVTGTKTQQLYGAPLDAVEEVKLNGVVKILTTDYTVNLTTGLLTLVADPGTTTNGLEVRVRKDSIVDASRIKKCTACAIYGGSNNSRAFLTGNPDYPATDWWTGIPLNGSYDPTYWPDTNSDKIGGDNDPVLGYAIQYDRMIVMKRHANYLRTWEIVTDAYSRTVTRFPAVPLNSGAGCIGSKSIQLVENNPFFLSDNGVFEIEATNIRDERDVRPVSDLVNIIPSGSMASIVFDGKYYLALGNDKVWVADYLRRVKDEATGRYQPVWYPWSNMPVNAWLVDGTTLIFGSNASGMVYRMKTTADLFPYNDLGAAIPCYFTSIFSTFDRDDMTKLIQNVIIRMKMWSRATINVEYFTEEGASGIIETEEISLLDFGDIDFSKFSFETSRVPQSFNIRIDDARNIQMFQIKLSSSGVPDEAFGFQSIDITYQLLSEVR